jgi:hypothetical protein
MIYDGAASVYTGHFFQKRNILYADFFLQYYSVMGMSGLSSGSRDVERSLLSFIAIFSAIFVIRCLGLTCEFLL